MRRCAVQALALLLVAAPAAACPVCFGDDGTGLASGLNAGIAVLLGLALLVQVLLARFLWRVAARSREESRRQGLRRDVEGTA